MSTDETFVIAGAGLAGAKAAQALREDGFAGQLLLLGEEPERPYERPPLSKGYLLGDQDRAAVYVHDDEWYAKNSVDLRLGCRVTGLDRSAHTVELADGERIHYTKLLLATGSSPRRLPVPGADLPGVHYLRGLADSDRLRDELRDGRRVVIAGAGWIGLEVAAAARTRGCLVTVVEPAPTPLHAVLGPRIGEFFAGLHRRHGVEFRFGTGVGRILGAGQVSTVVTADGDEIPADLVIVGIGVRPNVDLAERAGLSVCPSPPGGVAVDADMRTDDPDIYAAGDVAAVPSTRYGTRLRVEHWANAIAGGQAAARAMLGRDRRHDGTEEELPYFFSDQYDAGMEFAGWLAPGGHHELVIRGDLAEAAFHAFWLNDGQVVAGMHVNRWDEGIGVVQDLIRARHPVDPARLAVEA
ncbi:NAD(P)/FAD-dependent oxidoreductase [Actinophytocola sp. KF-1]